MSIDPEMTEVDDESVMITENKPTKRTLKYFIEAYLKKVDAYLKPVK